VHIAQMLCVIPDNPRLDLVINEEDKKDHQRWFDWQVRYKEAKEGGSSDEEARALALQP
jgi:hypothetical protein